MKWQRIEEVTIKLDAYYWVKTNGMLWGDPDLHVWAGHLVAYRFKEHYTRGRPVWVVEIKKPIEPIEPKLTIEQCIEMCQAQAKSYREYAERYDDEDGRRALLQAITCERLAAQMTEKNRV